MTEVSFAKSFLTTLDNKPAKYQQDHIFDPSTFGVRIPYTLPKLQHPPHPQPPKPDHDLSQSASAAPGAERATTTTNTINITLKSSKNPSFTFVLPSTPPSTTIADLKKNLHEYLGGSSAVSSVDKIKILHNKKPVPASKQTIADLVDTSTKDLELGVMVMGGAPDPPPQAEASVGATLRSPEPAGPGSENAAIEARTGSNPSTDANKSDAMEGIQPTANTTASEPVQPGETSGVALLDDKDFWHDLQGFLAQRLRNQDDAVQLTTMFEKAWRSSSAQP